MATNAQSTVEQLVSKYGLAMSGGLYVPAAGSQGFVHPGAVLAGTDPAGNQVGYAIPAASTDPSSVPLNGSWVSGAASATVALTIPAPGAGITTYLLSVVHSPTSATATQLVRLIITGLKGGALLAADTIVGTATSTPIILNWPSGVPAAVNTAITFTVYFLNPTTYAAGASLEPGNIFTLSCPRTPA